MQVNYKLFFRISFQIFYTPNYNSLACFLLPHQYNPTRRPRELPAISLLEPSCMVKKVPAKWWQVLVDVHLLNIFAYRVKISICQLFFSFIILTFCSNNANLTKIGFTFLLSSAVPVGFILLNETTSFLWMRGSTTFKVLITKLSKFSLFTTGTPWISTFDLLRKLSNF